LPAREIRQARALPGSVSAQAPSDLTIEDQVRDAINMANGAGHVNAVEQCDKSDDATLGNDTVTPVSMANAKYPNKDKSIEGKKKMIETLQDKLSVVPIAVAGPTLGGVIVDENEGQISVTKPQLAR
jgi:hypothetical protein